MKSCKMCMICFSNVFHRNTNVELYRTIQMQSYRSTAILCAHTGEKTDCLQLSLCLSQLMVSVGRFFLKGQMTVNAVAGWRMRTSRKNWRKWALVMTAAVIWLNSDANPAAWNKKNHSLQPVSVASEWTLKENQTGSWATRAGDT